MAKKKSEKKKAEVEKIPAGFELIQKIPGYRQVVYDIAWSPNGKILASAYSDGIIRLWDYENGELLEELEGHHDYVRSVAWSPDGKKLASGSVTSRSVCGTLRIGN